MTSPVIGSITPAWEAGLTEADKLLLEQMAAEESQFHRLCIAGEARPNHTPSEADYELALLCARHTRDPEQIERLMGSSPLARTGDGRDAKWSRHKTYLDRTIAAALERESELQFVVREAVRNQTGNTEAAQRLVYSDRDILTLPDPEWLIDGLLLKGGLIEVVGRYGAGKTFLLLDWLMHIAGGMAWQGRTVRRGPCLYVYGEGNMKPRVAAWRAAHRVDLATALGVVFMPASVNLLDDAAVSDLLSFIGEGRPAAIVFDTLSRMAPGNENEPDHGAAVVAACDRIQRATGAAVILGHHTPWSLEQQRPKGSSKIPDCADGVFLLENEEGALKLKCQKMRDGEAPAVIHLKLTPQDGALVVDRGTAPLSERDRILAAVGTDNPSTSVVAGRLSVSRRTAARLLNTAHGNGLVDPTEHGRGKETTWAPLMPRSDTELPF